MKGTSTVEDNSWCPQTESAVIKKKLRSGLNVSLDLSGTRSNVTSVYTHTQRAAGFWQGAVL